MSNIDKTYEFHDSENPRLLADHWFQNTPDGLTLFLVFYTRACRYSLCSGCNLPSLMTQGHIDYKDIMKQIDYVFHNLLDENQMKNIRKVIISNNGSVLDEDTFSTTALIYFIAKLNLHCPYVETVTLETRPEYVELEELEVISRALNEGDKPAALELAIGFEAFDDKIRNEYFRKGLELKKLEKLLSKIKPLNSKLKRKNVKSGIKLKFYFMQKPVVEITEEDAISDIILGIDYLSKLSDKYGIGINMHLNPTYVAKGTLLEKAFLSGKYTPPLLESVRKAVLYAQNYNISIFIGLNDEGLAVEGGSFIRDTDWDRTLVTKMREFNGNQNYELLKIQKDDIKNTTQ